MKVAVSSSKDSANSGKAFQIAFDDGGASDKILALQQQGLSALIAGKVIGPNDCHTLNHAPCSCYRINGTICMSATTSPVRTCAFEPCKARREFLLGV
jgi:hypothetical protein